MPQKSTNLITDLQKISIFSDQKSTTNISTLATNKHKFFYFQGINKDNISNMNTYTLISGIKQTAGFL